MRRSQRLLEQLQSSSIPQLPSPPVRSASDAVRRANGRVKHRPTISARGKLDDAAVGPLAHDTQSSPPLTVMDVRPSSVHQRQRAPSTPTSPPPSPPSASAHPTALYYAKRILQTRRVRGRVLFLVEWDGYPRSQATWEPLDNVRDSIAYQTFVFGSSSHAHAHTDTTDTTCTAPPHDIQVTISNDRAPEIENNEQALSSTPDPVTDEHAATQLIDVALYSDTVCEDSGNPCFTVSTQAPQRNTDTRHTPTFLCPNGLCGVYVSARNINNHINKHHLGSQLSREAATLIGVSTCLFCSKHFRQLSKHQCPVRHLTPTKHMPARTSASAQLIPVTSVSNALRVQLLSSDTEAYLRRAIDASVADQELQMQQRVPLLANLSSDGTERHVVDVPADGDCLYRAICVCWDIPQSQHYQLRRDVAAYLTQLSVTDLKQLCIRYDDLAQALQSATGDMFGFGCLSTDDATQHDVQSLQMHEWSDTSWIVMRDLYIRHVTLHRGRYGGLLDIQALCDSHCRNINIHVARDIMQNNFAPIRLQPLPDVVDDNGTADDIALLHVNWANVTAEGNHFDIICTTNVLNAVHNRMLSQTAAQDARVLPHTMVSTNVQHARVIPTTMVSTNVDAATNTDHMPLVQPSNAHPRDIPILMPLSLPPCYRHMPQMWRVVPCTAKHSWISLCSIYLQRAWIAHKQNDIDTRDRALVAFLLLPRRALRRTAGQRSAKYKLKRKLQQHVQHSRETQTAITVDDCEYGNSDGAGRARDATTSVLTQNVNRAAELMRAGHISRAAAAITQSKPVALTAAVIQQLQQLHPPAGAAMSACPDDAPELFLSGKDLLLHLRAFNDDGAAPGPSGWTGDLIIPLLSSTRCLDPLAMLLMLIINGEPRGQLSHMLKTMRGIPLAKPQSINVRPIDMGEVWVKIAGRIAMKQVDVARVFPTIQYGSAVKGGCEKAVHIVQTQLEKHIHDNTEDAYSTTVAISTDIANAFNTCSRAHIFSNMQDNQNTHPLLRMFHWSHSSPSHVLVYDHHNGCEVAAVIASAAGTKQGDLLASLGYNISMQPTYCAVQTRVPEVSLVAIHDDLTIVGQLKHVLKAFDYFAELLTQRGDLKLQPAKCRLLVPSTSTPGHVCTVIRQECDSRSLAFMSGCMPLLGSYVGADDITATAIVDEVVASCYPLLDALTHIDMPSHFAMLIMRHCITSKVAYLTRVTRPDVTSEALIRLDTRILTNLTTKLHLPPPQTLHSTTISLIRLPVSLGGLGITSAADSAAAAFLASVCLALPHLSLEPAAPYARSLAHAHAALLTPGTGVLASEKLPSTVEALLSTYSQPTPLVDGLQHHIQLQTSKHIQRAILASYTTNAQRAALLSASAPRAGIPLTSIPTADSTGPIMPSAQFDQYVRMRLQLPPRDTSPSACNIMQCGSELSDDIARTHHHQVCKHIRNREATVRHNKVLTTVLRIARDAGFAAAHEEPVRDEKGHKLRPDAIITPCSPQYAIMYIDVSVTHPASLSYNTQAADVTKPLATAKTRERAKHVKYDAVAAQDSARFIPLVLESYGAFGREFDSFLSLLGSAAADFHGFSEREVRTWVASAYRDIVVALHSGNALMAMRTLRATSFVDAH
jgi:hypothetical protein